MCISGCVVIKKTKFIIKMTLGITSILASIVWVLFLLLGLFIQGRMWYYEYNRLILVMEFIVVGYSIYFLSWLIWNTFKYIEEGELLN